MTTHNTILDDLYVYHDWANHKVFALAANLPADAWDRPREMGPGSLRATLYHIVAAEELWLERWQQAEWRKLAPMPPHVDPAEMTARLATVAQQRRDLMEIHRAEGWLGTINYRDGAGQPATRRLDDLLFHLANHGIYHRAQALAFLKDHGRTTPAGIDYLFYKLAATTCPQTAEAKQALQAYGLDLATESSQRVAFDRDRILRGYAYHDWANRLLLEASSELSESQLDRDFGLGRGSIRKTYQHLYEAELFWHNVWTTGVSNWQPTPSDFSVTACHHRWDELSHTRNSYVAALSPETAAAIVAVSFGGPPLSVRVVESMVQLVAHGTHHRAQWTNMLRHSGVKPPETGYQAWLPHADSP